LVLWCKNKLFSSPSLVVKSLLCVGDVLFLIITVTLLIFLLVKKQLVFRFNIFLCSQVQGWGKAAPFACLQLQKQAKKSRANETVNSCLFCLDMSTCAINDTRESCNGKLCSIQTFQGEKKSLPVKEYSIWHPEALKSKAVKTPEPTMPAPDSSESSNLKSLLVLPPVKDATPKDSADPSFKKSKAAISQANQKTLNATSAETASGSKGTKTIEQKGEKETDCIIHDTVKEKQIHEPLSFVPRLSKASFLQGGPEQLHWPCALWPDRKIITTSSSVSLRKNSHLANMQFLHTKGIQNTKHDEIRGPFTNSIKNRSLSEAKQGNESKIQAVQLLPGLFPSITVSHVAITAMSSRLT
uniref:Uncharacterized protein n=1 Tax=Chelydra serpentina TaxID=8475 RepID=A0A8C3RT93_CHESE